MSLYIGDSSKARSVKNIYIGVDGKARKVKSIYIGIGNTARLIYPMYVWEQYACTTYNIYYWSYGYQNVISGWYHKNWVSSTNRNAYPDRPPAGQWGYMFAPEETERGYEKGELIGTVSSDRSNAYPSDGYQGGYWYIKK